MSITHPSLISSIQSLDLRAKAIVEGFMSGLHKSPYHGFSVEFSEYRSYNSGDSIRDIDWKIYGKTEKLVIKKYEADTNLYASILFDVSASMNFKTNETSKLDYAKNLAAAIMYLLIKQNDSVSLTTFSKGIQQFIPAKTGRSHLNHLLHQLNKVNGEFETEISTSLRYVQNKMTKTGLIILFTDFLSDDEEAISQLKVLKAGRQDIAVFHIMDPNEIELNYSDKTIFKDMETDEEIELLPEIHSDKYQQIVQKFIDNLRRKLILSGIDYFTVINSDHYEKHLLEFLKMRQKSF